MASALAAPDEAALGESEGYPIGPGSVRPETRQFMLRGVRGQNVFAESKLVMVHTAAGDIADQEMGERVALWFAVVKSLAK